MRKLFYFDRVDSLLIGVAACLCGVTLACATSPSTAPAEPAPLRVQPVPDGAPEFAETPSVSDSRTSEPTEPGVLAADFEDAYAKFRADFNTRSSDLNHWVHPEYGVVVVGQPGTLVGLVHLDRLPPSEPGFLESLWERQLSCTPVERPLPEADCGAEWHADTDCYYQHKPRSLRKPAERYRFSVWLQAWNDQVSHEFRSDSPDEQLMAIVERVDQLPLIGVYDTANDVGFMFFAAGLPKAPRWYLAAIDTVDYCEA